ncbi:hypothetical protein MJO28_001299 [Puccinia striiformis f. sp. tritici]|uniref:Uncharacterized protein n=1 Tax=Puccinia striiformis f. sp. tritici TaxID=168172 RepID=A0ACC0ET47_9BASI|nr:hypothetical protein MJO28_001299 [Puccinia striiformis f. sp. tritici]
MADSENNASSKTDLVVEALDGLVHKYGFSLNQIFGDQLKDLTMDDMDEKSALLDELQSSLLPSVKEQIDSLLLSLDLCRPRSRKHPSPDFGLALESLSHLDQTLEKTVSSIECISLESPLPAETDDHHLKHCKEFRCSRLLWKIKGMVEGHLCELFRNCIQFIRVWELSSRHPYSFEHQTKISQKEADVLSITVESSHLIDTIIGLFGKTDLAILQEEWLAASESLSSVLEFLIVLSNCRKDHPKKQESSNPSVSLADGRTKARRAEVAEVARSAVPLVKLTRMFLKKISTSTNAQRLSFSLDSELNSETLNQLHQQPISIAERLDQFVRTLWMIHKKDEVIHDKDRIHTLLNGISDTLNSTLLLLTIHLIPTTHSINHRAAHSEPQFKTWLLTLKNLWHQAINHFLDSL